MKLHNHDLTSFNVDQLTTRKEITKLKILDIELESINLNCLKLMLLTYLKSEILEDVNSNYSEIIKTSKNLKYMFFSIFINVNNINKLHITVKKCDDILNILNN